MIKIVGKKHDNFSMEFKFSFENNDMQEKSEFAINTWLFVPNSLGINPETYGKNLFYRDIKSNVRLITPKFKLKEVADINGLPFQSLKHALERLSENPGSIDNYEYHLKMFAAIFKSSMRNIEHKAKNIKSDSDLNTYIDEYFDCIKRLTTQYRSLFKIIDIPTVSDKAKSYFFLCDEFIGLILEKRCIRIIRKLENAKFFNNNAKAKQKLVQLVLDERDYKISKGYRIINNDTEHNRELVYHNGMLKKYVESELFIKLDKKKDGVAVEQIYYSIAAGIAMIFATTAAWISQLKFGNITWPLFIVLVISYMLKDRIKELMRYYFAHKLGNKYYDKKASIRIGQKKVGMIKEGVDFISASKLPHKIMEMRNNSATIVDVTQIFDEKILLYRKRLNIDGSNLAKDNEYPMRGINEILRLHMTRFSQKMDNPEVPIDTISSDGDINIVKVQKQYYINIIFQLTHGENSQYKHFCVTMTRNGIIRVEEES